MPTPEDYAYQAANSAAEALQSQLTAIANAVLTDADRVSAEIIEALITDLVHNQRTAIYHIWLGCKPKVDNQAVVIEDAHIVLGRKMKARGLV